MSENIELSVSNEVIEKMAEIAACEIEGVSGLSKQQVDIKEVLRNKSAFKGVKVENLNGSVNITLFICLKKDVPAREVAEAVQNNVKDKIQTLTGTVVTHVNVKVADIDPEEKSSEE
ncbi:MAG: Asp23/Gls24 family envelope stress response protein [Clostridia bacterium]|nr:Asp23/Gls24 family envelope stress response protein [Clostridia bacterium]